MKINFLPLAMIFATLKNYGSENLEIKREAGIIKATHITQSQKITTELVVTKKMTDRTFTEALLYMWDKEGRHIKTTSPSVDDSTNHTITMLKEKINEYESSGRIDNYYEHSKTIPKSEVCSIL